MSGTQEMIEVMKVSVVAVLFAICGSWSSSLSADRGWKAALIGVPFAFLCMFLLVRSWKAVLVVPAIAFRLADRTFFCNMVCHEDGLCLLNDGSRRFGRSIVCSTRDLYRSPAFAFAIAVSGSGGDWISSRFALRTLASIVQIAHQ